MVFQFDDYKGKRGLLLLNSNYKKLRVEVLRNRVKFKQISREKTGFIMFDLLNSPFGMAGPVGFEPTISGSEGRHLNPC